MVVAVAAVILRGGCKTYMYAQLVNEGGWEGYIIVGHHQTRGDGN